LGGKPTPSLLPDTLLAMSALFDSAKRIAIGRKVRSDKLASTLLPKRIGFPAFSTDALSTNAYATQEVLLVLSLGGLALLNQSLTVALAVLAVMAIVIANYRQNVHAYPSGGGDYEIVSKNLGKNAGLVSASALMVDYVLTVAVSISAAVDNIGSAFPFVAGHKVAFAVGFVVVMTLISLRGVRDAGLFFAYPTYAFLAGILIMFLTAAFRWAKGEVFLADSAQYEIVAETSIVGIALIFMLARSFASGCTTLTGVEAVSNGVPAFREPKAKNAATTLLLLGVVSGSIFFGLTLLAKLTQVRVATKNEYLIGFPTDGYQQTVITQIADAVFGDFRFGFFFISATTAIILVLAANSTYSAFPVLASILARDEFLPKQLHTRGDRLAFSNGILALGLSAAALIYIFDGSVTRLVQLYILGVFISFTLTQFGMYRHWGERLPSFAGSELNQVKRYRVINVVGFVITGLVVIIVLLTKFLQGAWIVCLIIPILFLTMRKINQHYAQVRAELAVEGDEGYALPSRTHAVILVSKIHKPTLRAIAYARASRPSSLEAVMVAIDLDESRALVAEWDKREIPVPLRLLASPYREVTRPVLDYIRSIKRESPRDLIVVFLPEYVVGKRWEQLLHNQSALRLKTRLRLIPGVVVTNVPWQLASSERLAEN
jgi:amino acid transporter